MNSGKSSRRRHRSERGAAEESPEVGNSKAMKTDELERAASWTLSVNRENCEIWRREEYMLVKLNN
jgi:hypothetical protein